MIVFDRVAVDAEDGTPILRDVSLTLGGPRVAVIGANGSGKSTLARCVNGLTVPTRGTVTVNGRDTRGDRRRVQRDVGFVFQDADNQIVYPTPAEDVALGLRARGVGRRDAEARARDALRRMGLADVADQAVHTLSGGEKQLVALTGVLVLDPSWVVLDEPTAALDLANRTRVVAALDALGPSALVVSHDLEHVRTFPRALLMAGGEVVADGPPDEVIARYVALVGA